MVTIPTLRLGKTQFLWKSPAHVPGFFVFRLVGVGLDLSTLISDFDSWPISRAPPRGAARSDAARLVHQIRRRFSP